MNKNTFIQELEKGLKKLGVNDSIDIVKDYETHFENEFNKGKSEEEIAKELGSISDILADFQTEEKKVVITDKVNFASVITNDIFGYLGLFCLYIFNLTLVSTSITSIVIGIYLVAALDIFSFIPVLISPFSIFAGLTIVIFSVFSFGLSIQLFQSLNAMTKRLTLWNRKVLKGETTELTNIKYSKLVIRITRFSGVLLILMVIVSYIVGVLMTKEAQFWHYWNWFE